MITMNTRQHAEYAKVKSMNCATETHSTPNRPVGGDSCTVRNALPWATLIVAHVGLFGEIQPLATWFYPIAWWSFIVLMDRVVARRSGRGLLHGGWRRIVGLGLASLVFWLCYELINLRIANWYYVGVPENGPLRWLGITLSFATVVPLLLVTYQALLLTRMLGPCKVTPRITPSWLPTTMQVAGLCCLVLPLLFPRYAFPLVWGFMFLILEPINHRAGRQALFADLAEGSIRRLLAILLAGLLCGLLWEGWNFWAVGKWIYTVPQMPDARLFEMPPLGFLGFPALALAAVSFHTAVTGWWRNGSRGKRGMMLALALFVTLDTLAAMDRYTVDAPVPTLAGLAVLTPAERSVLHDDGVSLKQLAQLPDAKITSLAKASHIQPHRLVAARHWARLARHRGMGHANTALLWRIGIHSIADLAGQSPDTLAKRLGKDAPQRRKLIVWIAAARKLVAKSEG